MTSLAELQSRLGKALEANRPGSSEPHVVVALPSLSVAESLLAHYADRIPALEHRYLLAQLMLPRIENCEFVFISSQAPSSEVLDYHLSLTPVDRREGITARLRILEVPDRTARSVAAKLLDRPDLLADLRASLQGRTAFIEPWNVTEHEVQLARQLGIPINGTAPELWPLGFKSAGRRLFLDAGVPMPYGREDVRSIDEAVEAGLAIQSTRPRAAGLVIKTDDSAAGDGNRVIRFGRSTGPLELRATIEALPQWYLADLSAGSVVEELITGPVVTSPSVQVDIMPSGEPVVLATHEQVLGGPDGQVYVGCRFPASPQYAARLGRYGQAVGDALARRGALGRFSVDFMCARTTDGRWSVFALEINLRKGGTTHPYAVLRNLAPGHYDIDAGQWITRDGSPRSYESSDNVVDPGWLGRPPSEVIRAVSEAGLQFDPRSETGVVLHMLSCLAIDGRLGLTAIGRSAAEAGELYAATVEALSA
ncbi:MAG: peptide ligase PGM1-related protein [Actinomycetota bacterium]|nr:peptide ligase PGM1-related protein [Actinomycetota bacterium]